MCNQGKTSWDGQQRISELMRLGADALAVALDCKASVRRVAYVSAAVAAYDEARALLVWNAAQAERAATTIAASAVPSARTLAADMRLVARRFAASATLADEASRVASRLAEPPTSGDAAQDVYQCLLAAFRVTSQMGREAAREEAEVGGSS